MSRNRQQNGKTSGWGLLVFLILFFAPYTAAALLPLIIVGSVIFTLVKPLVSGKEQPRRESFDECPQSIFCRHKDNGEHHLKRGKEIDPWDRPDIDISKYQRRNGKDGA